MFSEVRRRSQKAGMPPGTLTYTGNKKKLVPKVTLISYSDDQFQEKNGTSLQDCLSAKIEGAITWVNLQGLRDVSLVKEIAQHYGLHPLTVEDILNVSQRPKIEEFNDYVFVTLKALYWNVKRRTLSIRQLSLVIGNGFVLTFQDEMINLFDDIYDRIRRGPPFGLQKKSSDYLAYRIIDTIVDNYFIVLEKEGDQIEKIEDLIISDPTKQTARQLYRLKRQILVIRKAIFPTRDLISHFLKLEGKIILNDTHIYYRDVYDHTVQAIDTVEIFRDMLSNMLDMYLSSLTIRMNEIVKVLTIIATIFMPITFIASVYGMNFHYMPELHWKWGYPTVLICMGVIVILMLVYFRRKNWW